MFTAEQKAWQLYENGVEYGELYMIHQEAAWDFDNPEGIVGFTMDDAVDQKWNAMFGDANG